MTELTCLVIGKFSLRVPAQDKSKCVDPVNELLIMVVTRP
jgi:hypothetical protein